MPLIKPIQAITYLDSLDGDISSYISPPYDVLDKESKKALLLRNTRNIVAIDLPHLQTKTAGPDDVYERAGQTFHRWLDQGILVKRDKPALFAYQQTYTLPNPASSPSGSVSSETNGPVQYRRRGLMANLSVEPFGRSQTGRGGIFPHELTHSGPKEDRLKLMRATRTQLSPIFGLFSDPDQTVANLLAKIIDAGPSAMRGTTDHDGVTHELWPIETAEHMSPFVETLSGQDIFIADGHHRYTTALNYRDELVQQQGPLPDDHHANGCLFVLVSMQDPGMIVLPTHRVLGGMTGFSMQDFVEAAHGKLKIVPFAGGGLTELEIALRHPPTDAAAANRPGAARHAMGLYDPANPQQPLAIATTVDPDPLRNTHPHQSDAWRQLDVAIVQHLIVEDLCEKHFCSDNQKVNWKFPHSLDQLKADADSDGYQLGVIMQPTPLESVRKVSEAGELMPPKSTFFYPKVATGMAINPLD